MENQPVVEKPDINIKNQPVVEKPTDNSFDSAKQEQESRAQEKIDSDQIANQAQQISDASDQGSTATEPVQTQSAEIVLKKVEGILSEGMDNIFLTMDAGTQREFKIKGEETSHKIMTLLSQAKVRVEEVASLILEWLRIIPKVNRHYIEQEAKIKADNILRIKQQ